MGGQRGLVLAAILRRGLDRAPMPRSDGLYRSIFRIVPVICGGNLSTFDGMQCSEARPAPGERMGIFHVGFMMPAALPEPVHFPVRVTLRPWK